MTHPAKRSSRGQRRVDAAALLALGVLISVIFYLVERAHPYFFLHDDNRIQYLPYFVHNTRAARQGRLAFYNWHQFLGTPHLANGNAAVLYPLSVAGTLLSEAILGHPFAAVDLVIYFHALIGTAGMYRLMRGWDRHPAAAAMAAGSWPLLGFFFYIGNSWFIATAALAWMPWMVHASCRLYRQTVRTDAGTHGTFWEMLPWTMVPALWRTLHFFAGHPQFFAYSVLFEGFFLLLLTVPTLFRRASRRATLRFYGYYALSLVWTLVWGLPLLLPLFRQMQGSVRSDVLDYPSFVQGTTALDLWIKGWSEPREGHVFRSISYYGWIGRGLAGLALPLIVVEAALFRDAKRRRSLVLTAAAVIAGAVAFIWAGDLGGFNRLIYRVPVLNRFRWPYKLLIQFGFFFVLLMGLGFHALIDAVHAVWRRLRTGTGRPSPTARGWQFLAALLAASLVVLQIVDLGSVYITSPVRAIRYHEDPIPRDEPLRDRLKDARIMAVGFSYQRDRTMPSLPFNYATLYGLHQMSGYEALRLDDREAPQIYFGLYSGYYDDRDTDMDTIDGRYGDFRRYGVRYYIVHPEYVLRHGPPGPPDEPPFRLIAEDDDRLVFEDEAACAWLRSGGETPDYDLKETVNALDVEIRGHDGGEVMINVFPDPNFVVTVDGETVEARAEAFQLHVDVPPGDHRVVVRFVDRAFYRGALTALLVTLVAAVAVAVTRCRARRRSREIGQDPEPSAQPKRPDPEHGRGS